MNIWGVALNSNEETQIEPTLVLFRTGYYLHQLLQCTENNIGSRTSLRCGNLQATHHTDLEISRNLLMQI